MAATIINSIATTTPTTATKAATSNNNTNKIKLAKTTPAATFAMALALLHALVLVTAPALFVSAAPSSEPATTNTNYNTRNQQLIEQQASEPSQQLDSTFTGAQLRDLNAFIKNFEANANNANFDSDSKALAKATISRLVFDSLFNGRSSNLLNSNAVDTSSSENYDDDVVVGSSLSSLSSPSWFSGVKRSALPTGSAYSQRAGSSSSSSQRLGRMPQAAYSRNVFDFGKRPDSGAMFGQTSQMQASSKRPASRYDFGLGKRVSPSTPFHRYDFGLGKRSLY